MMLGMNDPCFTCCWQGWLSVDALGRDIDWSEFPDGTKTNITPIEIGGNTCYCPSDVMEKYPEGVNYIPYGCPRKKEGDE